MKVTIDIGEIPIKAARIPKTAKASHASHHLSINPTGSGLILYAPDWGIHYDVVLDAKGKPSLKKVGEEECMR